MVRYGVTITELKKYIYQNEKIQFVLNAVGCHNIKYHANKEYYSCSNPDGDNKAAVNIKNNEYLNCINRTRKISDNDEADLITLVQFYRKESFVETIKYLHKLLGLKMSYEKPITKKKEEKFDPLYIFKKVKKRRHRVNVLDFNVCDNNVLEDFIPHIHIDFYRSGIMPWTVDRFGLGYSYKYKRTIIPLKHWCTGELLGTNARTSVENYDELGIKKYFTTPSYPKSINLFGLYENHENIERAGCVVVYESERSVLKRHSLGDSTGVALMGHNMSDEQVRILLGLDIKEIILAFDCDISVNEVRYICEKFYRIRKVSYIHDKYGVLKGEKDSPADAENKVFDYLFKYRVEYTEKEHREYLRGMKQ